MQDFIYEPRLSLLASPTLNETIRTSNSNHSICSDPSLRKDSNSDTNDCTTKLTCLTNSFKRKKSSSLNSPPNSGKKNIIKKFFFLHCSTFCN